MALEYLVFFTKKLSSFKSLIFLKLQPLKACWLLSLQIEICKFKLSILVIFLESFLESACYFAFQA